MRVYLVIDRPPSDFGEWRLLGGYLYKKDAVRHMKDIQGEDPYANQYVAVVPLLIKK
jgi:hypothetical protein